MGLRRTSRKPSKAGPIPSDQSTQEQPQPGSQNPTSQYQPEQQQPNEVEEQIQTEESVYPPAQPTDSVNDGSPKRSSRTMYPPPPIDTSFTKGQPAQQFHQQLKHASSEESSNRDQNRSSVVRQTADETKISSSNTDLEGGVSLVRAVVRIRPMNAAELSRYNNEKTIQATDDQKAIQIYSPDGKISAIAFDSTFPESTTQSDFFEKSGVRSLISQAMDGYCATVFAFGQTGSGKTFTITGPDSESIITPESVGLVPRSLSFIFSRLTSLLQTQQLISARVQASFLEIYNEHVQDLLNPANSNLPVRWTAERGFFVENLFIVDCDVLDDCLAVLEEGLRNRTVAAHEMNEHSSRSHSVMTIYFETVQLDSDEGRPVKKHGKLSFVDLAGSEKVKESKTSGETFSEALSINKSLLSLGQCISALADPRKRNGHIPFRDSKLTKLLSDSLGGNGVALMVACISPSYGNLQETIKTLRYAARARRIENRPVVQLDPKEEVVLLLKREIQMLRKENNALRTAIESDPRSGGKEVIARAMAKSAGAFRSNTSLGRQTPRTPKNFETPFSTITSPLSPTFGVSAFSPRTVSIAEDALRANPRSSPEKYRATPFPQSAGSRASSRSGPTTSKSKFAKASTPASAKSRRGAGARSARKGSIGAGRPSAVQQRIAGLRRSDAPAGQERVPKALPYGKKGATKKPDEKITASSKADVSLPKLPAARKSKARPPLSKREESNQGVALPPIDSNFSAKDSDRKKGNRPSRRSPDPTLTTSPMFPNETPPETRKNEMVANTVSNRHKLLEDVVALDQEIGRLQNGL